MKRKEIQNLAKKIAKQEQLLQEAITSEEKQRAEIEIMKLCSQVRSIEDMTAVEEEVEKIMNKNS